MPEHELVTVDEDRCVGSGECARVAPTAFALDEDEGLAVVLDTARATPPEQLERAVRECPTGAIRLAAHAQPQPRDPNQETA